MPKVTKPCGVPLTLDRDRQPDLDGPRCTYLRKHGGVKCVWHWLMKQPIEVAVQHADRRLKNATDLGMNRPRVAASECPPGERWCAGCQSFVPLFYVSGSRCRACNSRAAHASHIKRTYDLDAAEYERLLAWQGGACYICRQVPRVRRLAVDHDHDSGEVRGLLCANDEWGCNVQLSRLLNDVEMARRALAYVERHPITRMRQGEEPRERVVRENGIMKSLRAAQEGPPEPAPVELGRWDPFAA